MPDTRPDIQAATFASPPAASNLPARWQALLGPLLDSGENLLAWLETDLDARLP